MQPPPSALALFLTRLRAFFLTFTRFFERDAPHKNAALPSTTTTAIREKVAEAATTGWRSLPGWALGAERPSQPPTRLCERQTDPTVDSAVPASLSQAPTVSWSRLPGWAVANPADVGAPTPCATAPTPCAVVQHRELPADDGTPRLPSFVRPDDPVLVQLHVLAEPTLEERMLCEALGEPDLVLVNLGVRAQPQQVASARAVAQSPAQASPLVDATISVLSDETVRLSIRLL